MKAKYSIVWAAIFALLLGCRGPVEVHTNGSMATKISMVTDHTVSPVKAILLPGSRNCDSGRIAVIDMDGLLVNRNMYILGSIGENPVAIFREKLDAIANDPRVCAVVLRINSHGGGVTACDMMRRDLVQFKQEKNVPIIACLMDVGTGGAYYIATAADHIVAHPTTITGGMGVILNLYNLQDAMAQFNVLGVPIKSGEMTDLGSPLKPMTPESRAVLQGIADEFAGRFRGTIASSRSLRQPTGVDIFDGRIFTAQQAQLQGMVDSVGYLDDAVSVARSASGDNGQAGLVMYRRANDRALSPYDITPNIPLQHSILSVSIPGIDRSQLPTFLCLWQPEPLIEKTGGN